MSGMSGMSGDDECSDHSDHSDHSDESSLSDVSSDYGSEFYQVDLDDDYDSSSDDDDDTPDFEPLPTSQQVSEHQGPINVPGINIIWDFESLYDLERKYMVICNCRHLDDAYAKAAAAAVAAAATTTFSIHDYVHPISIEIPLRQDIDLCEEIDILSHDMKPVISYGILQKLVADTKAKAKYASEPDKVEFKIERNLRLLAREGGFYTPKTIYTTLWLQVRDFGSETSLRQLQQRSARALASAKAMIPTWQAQAQAQAARQTLGC